MADVLGALIQQGLVDSEDSVISRALECFTRLIEFDLMSKSLALEVADKVLVKNFSYFYSVGYIKLHM